MGVRYETRIPGLIRSADDVANRVIHKGAMDILAHSQREVPVDTGNLKNSGSVETGDLTATIAYGAGYAVYVHEGTRKRAARPFLRSAFDSVAPEIEKALRKVVEP